MYVCMYVCTYKGNCMVLFIITKHYKQAVSHQQGIFGTTLYLDTYNVSQFSRSVISNFLRPHGLQYARLPCSSPIPGACSNSCRSSWQCHPAIKGSFMQYLH